MKGPSPLRNRAQGFPAWPCIGMALLFLVLVWRSSAQLPEETLSFRSFSGQFIVQAPRSPTSAFAWSQRNTNTACIWLDPKLVPISCERIRLQVSRAVGISGSWQGTISVGLYPSANPPDRANVVSKRFRDGWSYRVELPQLIDKTIYVRAIVQACLQEYANRAASTRSAELPLWLVEGLTQEVLQSREIEIILPPPHPAGKGVLLTSASWETKRLNSLESIQDRLKSTPALTFEELSWPPQNLFKGPEAERFRTSAQLFLKDLQALKGGRHALRTMLELLPRYLNWQFAFFEGFKTHFQKPLDVEKWWTLRLIQVSSHDSGQRLPLDESLDKLKQCLLFSAQVFTRSTNLPSQAEVSLQVALLDWSPADADLAIQRIILSLQQIRLRSAVELLPIIDAYTEALYSFLQARPKRRDALKPDLIKHLDDLDVRARTLRALSPVPDTNSSPSLTLSSPNPHPR